jgi:hypothetical protein
MRLALTALVLAAGCAQPVAGLWPPRPGEDTRQIVVSTDAWHSVICLTRDHGGLEEWGYADKSYYLEGHDGVSGTLDALILPGAGVIHVACVERAWGERTPQPPGRVWHFDLTREGYARLLSYLQTSSEADQPCSERGGLVWFDAKSAYHMFHHCHHWAAGALREAGLPVWPLYAQFKWTFEAQLDRAADMATAPVPAE